MKQFFGNLSVAAKLGLIVGLLSACMALQGIVAFKSNAQFGRTLELSTGKVAPRLVELNKISVAARQTRTRQYRLLVAKNEEKRAGLFEDIAENVGQVETAIADYSKYATEASDKANVEKLTALWNEYKAFHDQLPGLFAKNDKDAVIKVLEKDSRDCFVENFIPLVESMTDWNAKQSVKLYHEGQAVGAKANTFTGAALISCLILGISLSFLVIRSIIVSLKRVMAATDRMASNEMTQLSQAMSALANADLTVPVDVALEPLPVYGRDELARTSEKFNVLQSQVAESIGSYNEARASLAQIVKAVREHANGVAEASGILAESTEQSGRAAQEIAQSSEKLANSATDVASAMERYKTVIEEIDGGSAEQAKAVDHATTALNASEGAVDVASASAHAMSDAAKKGGEAVEETITSMASISDQVQLTADKVRELDEKGQQIGQIVSTIDAIAMQTNLLALNAAIEAARAGDHGRGFAVVADEVRKLAEQSSLATKEISSLIESVRATVKETVEAIELAQGRVDVGAEQSRSTGQSLMEIVETAADVASQLEAVKSASATLGKSISQVKMSSDKAVELTKQVAEESSTIGANIEEVAAIGEETAAGSEEMSASSEEVAASAADLNDLASKLRHAVSSFKVEEQVRPETLRQAA